MDAPAGQLTDLDGIGSLVQQWRREGRTIVTTNGSFDVMHAGHARYLREAADQGDVLVVGLNSDESVRAYKGHDRPIFPQDQRAEMLLALRCVNAVAIFDETTPMRFIRAVRPDVHVNGAEYGRDCIEAETVAEVGARLHLVPRVQGLSTTMLIDRIRSTLAPPKA